MRTFFYIVAMFSCFVGAFFVNWAMSGDFSAIQQSPILALACAVVIIPYVFARSYQEIRRASWDAKLAKQIGAEVAKANQPSAGDS